MADEIKHSRTNFWAFLAVLISLAALSLAFLAYDKSDESFQKVNEVERLQRQEDIQETDSAGALPNEGVGADGSIAPPDAVTR